MLDVRRPLLTIASTELVQVRGAVREISGLAIHASAPGAKLGDVVEILPGSRPALLAEVVGFTLEHAVVMPLGALDGIAPGDPVRPTGGPLRISCSDALLGRVLDGLGAPLDGGPPIAGEPWSTTRSPPNALDRPRIDSPMAVGIRAIDGLMTIGRGQRVGIFSGSGVGKSTLLAQIARQADADVFVLCLIGERGREVVELIEDGLGPSGLARGVVVCATSDAPALVRLRSAMVATAIAEWFRDRGRRVVLMMDSLTRFARAGREVGLAAGEPPARRGYPPSVFAMMPRLLERAGQSAAGSITAFYTVLVEGGDLDEPVADEVRGILDGHIVLDRALAARGRFPAIDPVASLSRSMDAITTAEHQRAAAALRAHLSLYESKRDLVLLGAYKAGSDPRLDAALERIERIEAFLRQRRDEREDLASSLAALAQLE